MNQTEEMIEMTECNSNPADDATNSETLESEPLVSQLKDADLQELVEYFVGELPGRIASFEEAARLQELSTLEGLAHQMKGAAAGYGFPAITDAAEVLEMDIKSCSCVDKINGDLDVLINLCRRATC